MLAVIFWIVAIVGAAVAAAYLSDLFDNTPPMSDSEPRHPAGC